MNMSDQALTVSTWPSVEEALLSPSFVLCPLCSSLSVVLLAVHPGTVTMRPALRTWKAQRWACTGHSLGLGCFSPFWSQIMLVSWCLCPRLCNSNSSMFLPVLSSFWMKFEFTSSRRPLKTILHCRKLPLPSPHFFPISNKIAYDCL